MFAVIPSFYLETKLRTNSASTSGQTPPKQTVASLSPRTTSQQQLTPIIISPLLENYLQKTLTKINSGT
jgi:hypothetical protein